MSLKKSAEITLPWIESIKKGSDLGKILTDSGICANIPGLGVLLWLLLSLLGTLAKIDPEKPGSDDADRMLEFLDQEKGAVLVLGESLGLPVSELRRIGDQDWRNLLGTWLASSRAEDNHQMFVRDHALHAEVMAALIGLKFNAQFDTKVAHFEFNEIKSSLSYLESLVRQLSQGTVLSSAEGKRQLRLRRPHSTGDGEDANPFYFANVEDKDLFGRVTEFDRLRDFLNDPRDFAWWSIYGHGGEGKSRLALALCDWAMLNGWTAGFFDRKYSNQLDDLMIDRPTLIVVDYVFLKDAAHWRDAVARLAQEANGLAYPLRILMLDRTASGSWWDQFFSSEETLDFQNVKKYRFDPEPMLLGPLDDQPIIELFESTYRRLGGMGEPIDVLPSLQKLQSPNEKGSVNPPALFAMLAAEATVEGLPPSSWSRSAVLGKVLDRMIRNWREAKLNDEHLSWLAYATVVRASAQSAYPRNAQCHIQKDQLEVLGNFSDYEPVETRTLRALVPDPLGEFFVLERLTGRAVIDGFAQDVSEATLELLASGLSENLDSTMDFIGRAVVDYPEHSAWPLMSQLPITHMDLYGRPLRTLEPIRELKQLSTLKCSGTSIDSLEPIHELELLSTLDCSDTMIDSLEPIRELKQLTEIYCSGTRIDSLEPIRELTHLSTLDCSDTMIDSLEPIRELKQLTEIYCSGTRIDSLEPIRELTHLSTLVCPVTSIDSLEPIRELKQLTEIYCSGTRIDSLEPIRELKLLNILDCSVTSIDSLEPIRELTHLTFLDCTVTSIDSLDPIRELKQLIEINCSVTRIASLEPIRKLKLLNILDCSVTSIDSLEPIRELTHLTTLNCSDTMIDSLEPIRELKQLSTLKCSGTSIDSLEPIRELTDLCVLHCSSNKVKSLGPLHSWKGESIKVYVSKGQIADKIEIPSIVTLTEADY